LIVEGVKTSVGKPFGGYDFEPFGDGKGLTNFAVFGEINVDRIKSLQRLFLIKELNKLLAGLCVVDASAAILGFL
jgi:hypothetical protein